MAKLEVEVRLGDGVAGYALFVDGIPAAMGADHRGEAECAGRCGDGSTHALLYTLSGVPGARLAITVRCSARIVCGLSAEIGPAAGSPWRAGRELFAI
ncbi:MAG: hypothetical protein QOJ91_2117 [Sphingomonadales bacterium]|jgi:hypothetical protein|nr:hypothetical protein [Sphingomonadales bacterium]